MQWNTRCQVQNIIDKHYSPKSLYTRILQSIFNSRLRPSLEGPKIRLSRKPVTKKKRYSTCIWEYIPVYLRRPVAMSTDKQYIFAFIQNLQPTPRRCNYIRSCITYVWTVCHKSPQQSVVHLTRSMLLEALDLNFGGSPCTRRIACAAVNRYISEVVHVENALISMSLKLPQHRSFNKRTTQPIRDHFIHSEVQMMLCANCGTRDHLIIRILSETGLRRLAVASLALDNIFGVHVDCTDVRTICSANEKGGMVRYFALSDGTKDVLKHYMRTTHPGRTKSNWIFPSTIDLDKHIQGRVVNDVVRRVATGIGITGRHVHAHGMRNFTFFFLLFLFGIISSCPYCLSLSLSLPMAGTGVGTVGHQLYHYLAQPQRSSFL